MTDHPLMWTIIFISFVLFWFCYGLYYMFGVAKENRRLPDNVKRFLRDEEDADE